MTLIPTIDQSRLCSRASHISYFMSRKKVSPVEVENEAARKREEKVQALGDKGKTKLDDWKWLRIPTEKGPVMDLFDSLFPDIEEWALEDEWEPQTVAEFDTSERWKVSKSRRTIFIQPLAYDSASTLSGHPSIQQLADFTSTYFGLSVKVQSPLQVTFKGPKTAFIDDFKIATSPNEFGEKRLSVLSVMDYLFENLPTSAYCVLAITDLDIYEDASITEGSAIMGRGSGDRVGILSLYRFNPNLSAKVPLKKSSRGKSSTIDLTDDAPIDQPLAKWMLPACKTLAHESMHMFGLDHCTHFLCVMNANVSPLDDGKDPIHLCPVCLRKLYNATKFDFKQRFSSLQRLYHDLGWTDEETFVTRRIELSSP